MNFTKWLLTIIVLTLLTGVLFKFTTTALNIVIILSLISVLVDILIDSNTFHKGKIKNNF
ncbi:hypothetical protein [Clostridium septicum]|uniref:Uncharacterized protein n=1 Tax=Clostridium septicum TaxID=1504 RepID=A0A9N7PL28_CLOSE|nr:hypothetical protein [Clostridium septicum]AYE34902.1 hypothetical protein CP523_11045 [Clostridium septicum]MDU1313879.1 hypothetical protein [Clostridium septicum]QAS60296.1 hypothetical protein EI377_05835 [Clostridium septicum]UEC20448.1 hypothetical protein LK444_13785 [Clostridium septicum]USS01495.1 hypothetical protein NH397_03390 [Clostridium septicum]